MADIDPLDGPPQDDLARAFRLPPSVAADEELAALFNAIVVRFRREAIGLPMNTVGQLFIERMATHYLLMKVAEESDRFTPTQRKDANATWVQMTIEFNRMLEKSDDKLRDAMKLEIQDIVMEALKLITDQDERREVRRRIAGDFAAINV